MLHGHGHVRTAWLLRAAALASAALLFFIPWAGDSASAQDSTVDPMSRNYSCWQRWGDDYQNPAMATEDPMCWQAWQDDTAALKDWNGLYRVGVADEPQSAVPNGTLCSAGHTADGLYDSLDTPGPWTATAIPDSGDFTVDVYDAASHGADYVRVYVSKPSFDSTKMSLGWDNIELIVESGPSTPDEGTPQEDGATVYSLDVSAPGLTGRHVVYTVWQATNLDQTFYSCADVNFG